MLDPLPQSRGPDDTRQNQAVLVVIGDASRLDESYIEDMEIVEYVRAITQPYKLSGRNSPDDASIIDVGGVKIGGGTFTMIAGPCSVGAPNR